jgi:hypothetical protein
VIPETAAQQPTSFSKISIGVASVAAASVASLFRQRGVPSWDSVWAEDGKHFLADAINRPFLLVRGWFSVNALFRRESRRPRVLVLIPAPVAEERGVYRAPSG